LTACLTGRTIHFDGCRHRIDVSYQSEPIRGLLLPIEMREWYVNLKTGSRIETIANYARFRQTQEQ
jgi:hypothetical protein